MAVILGLTAVSGIGTVTLARYVGGYETGWLQIKPEKFYFTSDILEPKGNTVTLYNWNSSQDYVFFTDIRNWEDDFRVSPDKVSYHVTITADGTDGITGAVNGTQSPDGTYTIAGGLAQTQKLVITVPAGKKPTENRIKVTVKAEPADGSGYTKTLTGTLVLKEGTETCKAEAEVHNAYIDLLIGVDKGQTVGITWPSWLTPDNTNIWMAGAQGSTGSVTLEDESSCRLRFFITGEGKTSDSFKVTEDGGASQTIPVKQ